MDGDITKPVRRTSLITRDVGKFNNSDVSNFKRESSEIDTTNYNQWLSNKPQIKITKEMDFASVKGKQLSSNEASDCKMKPIRIDDKSSNSSQ